MSAPSVTTLMLKALPRYAAFLFRKFVCVKLHTRRGEG